MSFYSDFIVTDPRYRTTELVNDIWLLEPVTRDAVQALIAEAALSHGITLRVTETYRSVERQAFLYATHKTELKTVGCHHFGVAADFARIENGKADWSTADWLFLGDLATNHGLVWGGDWGTPAKLHQPGLHDYDHVQRITLDQEAALFAGTWYPA